MSFQQKPAVARPLWLITACAFVILFLLMGLRQGFGLFLQPVCLDLGISRQTFGFGFAISNLLWGLGAPVAGAIADRHGAGRVAALGGLLYAGGMFLFASATGNAQYVLGNVFIGIGLSGAGFSVVLAAVGKAAPPERRVAALSAVSLGGSFGQFLMIPGTQALISGLGWAGAFAVLGALALLIVPLSRAVSGIQLSAEEAGTQTFAAALQEAFALPSFWLITIGFFVCGFQLSFIMTHLPAFLQDSGMPVTLGAAALATVGLTNVFGTYAFGWLGERMEKRAVLAGLYFVRGIFIVILTVSPLTPTSVLLFSAGMGLTWLATIPLTGGLVSVLFGPAYLGTLYGFAYLSHQVGGFLGAWISGYTFDATGSYALIWWMSAGLSFTAAALNWAVTEKPVVRASTQPVAA